MNIVWNCPNCKRLERTSPNVHRLAHLHGKEEIELAPYKKPMKPRGLVTVKSLKKEVWDLFSEWVRRSEADENGYCKCVTCGSIRRWLDGDAGHYIHGTSFFVPELVHFQCKQCNGYGSGMAEEYSRWMITHYTEQQIAWFRKQAKGKHKLSIFDLQQYKKLYSDKLKELI